MRIAHTVEFYRPRLGGAERVVEKISEHLTARGHSVTVFTSAIDGAPPEEELNGVRVRRFNIRGNEVHGIRGDAADFVEDLIDEDYDVVMNYACQSWPTDLTFRSLADIHGVKVIAPCGYSALKSGPVKRALYRSYFRRLPSLLKSYAAVVYTSRSYIDFQLGEAWGLTNGTVIQNGVDLSEFSDLKVPSRRARSPEVVSIGNHYRVKNHRDFFRLAERCPSEIHFTLICAPEHVHRGCFERCVHESEMTGVTLMDGRDRALVLRKLAQCVALAITSRLECAPLVALEAMAAGVPFVSYDVGCVRDFPGGVVVKDLREMTRALEQIVADDALWHALADAGRRFAAQHDWSVVATRFETLYSDLLERAHRSERV